MWRRWLVQVWTWARVLIDFKDGAMADEDGGSVSVRRGGRWVGTVGKVQWIDGGVGLMGLDGMDDFGYALTTV